MGEKGAKVHTVDVSTSNLINIREETPPIAFIACKNEDSQYDDHKSSFSDIMRYSLID